MKAGRYRSGAETHYFVVATNGAFLDWRKFEADGVSAATRAAVREALATGAAGPFCAALPLLERFLRERPGFGMGETIAPPAALESPVTPRSFVCVGVNYRGHAQESGIELPSRPLLFAKTGNALSGHGHPIRLPADSTQVDYEAELAVVIGRPCRDVSAERALEFVAGYTCANDISARDYQFADGQWFRAKSCDSFGPLGPWLVTPDEVGDPHELGIRLRLNGRLMQDANATQLVFRVPELIAYISRYITLQPGDVISTGTPTGVGMARKPPIYLKPGDNLEVEIDRLGVLANSVEGVEAG